MFETLTATPKAAWAKGQNVKDYQRYIAGRRESTLAVWVIFSRNPYAVSCTADPSCNITIDYKEGEAEIDSDIFDTTAKMLIAGVELLEDKYVIENKTEVAGFLNEHSRILESLLETHEQIQRIFENNIVDVRLSLSKDHEEDFTGLSLIIKTPLKSDDSLALLDRFDEEWWLDIDTEIRNVVTVMVRTV